MSDFYTNVERVFSDWTYGHPKVLYGLIRSMKPAVCVEIGTYRGFGAAWMAKALQENNTGHLYCVDNFSLTDHEPRYGNAIKHLESNLISLGVRDFVTIINGESTQVNLPSRIDLAYIDGWHSYLVAKSDFQRCASAGAECICFDDTTQSVGPRMLTYEIRATGEWDVIDILRDCGMSICMRKQPKDLITFSQELPGHPGVDLQVITKEEQRRHLSEASKINGVDYSKIEHLLHEGVK